MDTHHAIEFAHGPLAADATESALLDAALAFEDAVLAPHPGFLFHAVVRNDRGRYGHFVVADRAARFAEVEAGAATTPATRALFACLDLPAIRLFHHRAIGAAQPLPDAFGVLEHGSFEPRAGASFSEAALDAAARQARDGHLRRAPGFLAQLVAHAGDRRYAEIVLGESAAHARRTCARYPQEPACAALLALCEPASVELDFWIPLLQRRFLRAS